MIAQSILRAFLVVLVSVWLTGCEWAEPEQTQLHLSLSNDQGARLLSRAAISDAYPSLSQIRLGLSTPTLTTADINEQYNFNQFKLTSDGSAIILNDTQVSLYVPVDEVLTVTLSAINLAGYQVFSGSVQLTVADLSAPSVDVAVPMAVDVDSTLPIIYDGSNCTDSDFDYLCDEFEDLFVNAAGDADIDGDGLLNRDDVNSDGDGLDDYLEYADVVLSGGTLVYDANGYPLFVVKNNAPQITSTAITSATEDLVYSYSFAATDADANDTVTLSAFVLPAWLTFDTATGELSGTPTNAEVGDHAVTLRADDGTDVTDQSFTITVSNVNDAPTIASTAITTATQGVAYSYTLVASDVDTGDTLTLSGVAMPTWLTFNSGTGVLSGSPSNADVGNHNITLRVNDGTVNVDQTFTITVANVNDAPTVDSIAVTAATQNSLYSYTFTASDIDVADVITLSATVLPNWLTFDAGTGVLSGTPANADVGDHNVTLQAADLSSVATDQSFVITVANVNDAPIITSSAVTAATQGSLYSYSLVASDIDLGDTLTLSAPVLPTWIIFDPITGLLTGTPANAEVGAHNVTLRVNDGTVDVDQTFTITVANVNDAPTITPMANIESTPGAHIVVDVLASSSDPDIDIGQPDTLSIVNASVTAGSVRMSPDNRLLYFLSEPSDTTATISYTIRDALGLTVSDSVTIDTSFSDADGDGINSLNDSDDSNPDSDGDGFSDYFEAVTDIAVSPSANWTDVTANITTNTVWDISGSPYVIGDLTLQVTSGAELRIEQGVEVKFSSPNSALQIDSGAFLSVLGGHGDTLAVRFTSVNDDTRQPITDSSGSPAAGDWAGISLLGGFNDFFINAQMLYSNDGFYIEAGQPELDNVVLEHNFASALVINNLAGSVYVSDSIFTNNPNAIDILALGVDSEITNSVFRNNKGGNTSGQGGAIAIADAQTSTVTVSNSLMVFNEAANGGAIYVGVDSLLNLYGSTISLNASTTSGNAIYVASGTNTVEVIDSLFDFNDDCGDGCVDDITVGDSSFPVKTSSLNNLTDASGNYLPVDVSNITLTNASYSSGWYQNQFSNPAIDSGSFSVSAAPEYYNRLLLATTDQTGAADAGIVDIGFHYSSAEGVADNARSIISSLSFTSQASPVASEIVVTPIDSNGRKLGAKEFVTVDYPMDFFIDSAELQYQGDGRYLLQFDMPATGSCLPSEDINIYVNGTVLDTVTLTYGGTGC